MLKARGKLYKQKASILAVLFIACVLILPGCSIGTTLTSSAFPSSHLSFTPPSNNQTLPSGPVEIVSVIGPIPQVIDGKTMWNPAGPVVEITLKNTTTMPLVSINATLNVNQEFYFNFEVTSLKPLLPGQVISARQGLIGGGFSDTENYALTVYGTAPNGASFISPKQVKITAPAQ